ncbi:MAG: hypothetical protein EP330_06065 [Deltaproteobacteria bacterium]|nr:MAG: hypothetical protein EP330_06065 [Deltaproteobacteria bacterium]
MRLDANLRVLGGTTSEETVVDGVRLPAQTRFERMIDREGATRLYSARAPVAWTVGGLQLEPGERFYPHDPGQPAE